MLSKMAMFKVPVSKEQLRVGERVFYDYQAAPYGAPVPRSGTWDGEAVIPVRELCGCNLADCVAEVALNRKVAEFNRAMQWRFVKGAHIFTFPSGYQRKLNHQGIYDGKGYVYHFDDSDPATDRQSERCEECKARGRDHRAALLQRGLGPTGLRKSCLYCFSNGRSIGLVKYEVGLLSRVCTAAIAPGTRTLRRSRQPEDVVRDAKEMYEDNGFG